ncbi:MAG: type I 3-dehydroquinate dehydratase [Thomasclavelia ramosa]
MGVCKVKNIVIGEGMPKICVPVVSNNHQDIITDLIRLQSLDIDLIELRIDYFNELLDRQKLTELFKAIASMAIKQGIILTYRSVPEGGNGKLSNDEYMQLYSIALESGAFDIYDVELSSGTNAIITLNNMIHEANRKVIMSSHDFTRTPSLDTMLEKIKQMDSLEADIIKLAVMPEDYKDVLLVLEMTLRANEIYDKPIVTMSMSNLGIATRILGEQFGSAITFGKDNVASASGQIDIRSLKEALKIVHENS